MSSKSVRTLRPILPVAGLLILLAAPVDAAPVNWHTDYRKAAAESSRSGKPILVEFTAPWCGYCRKMQETMADARVSQHVEKCFIPLIIDTDEDVNSRLVQSVGIEGLPTTAILTSDMKVVKKITGYKSPTEMSRQLARLCTAHAKPAPAQPAAPYITKKPAALPKHRFAFDGKCLVSMFDEYKVSSGSSEFVSRYKGVDLRFKSAELKRRFDLNPERYWPAFDGMCPVSAAEGRTKTQGNPKIAGLYEGRVWFFASDREFQVFSEDPTRFDQAAR